MFSVLEMVTPDTYTRIARHSIDGWTVLLKLYWAITPSPSPQLNFPVFITRGRKQSTTELEPLSPLAEWTSDTYTRIAMHSIFPNLTRFNHMIETPKMGCETLQENSYQYDSRYSSSLFENTNFKAPEKFAVDEVF